MKSCCKLLKQCFCVSSDSKVTNQSLGTKFLSVCLAALNGTVPVVYRELVIVFGVQCLNRSVVATELPPEIHVFVDALKKVSGAQI